MKIVQMFRNSFIRSHVIDPEPLVVRFITCVAICWIYAVPALSESDVDLRSTFGPPTKLFDSPHTEVFRVRPGLELKARYSPDHQLCTIELPRGVASAHEVNRVLQRAVPSHARGREWNGMETMVGVGGTSNTYYERLIISKDIFTSSMTNRNPGAKVVFKRQACGWKPGQDIFDAPRAADQLDESKSP
jgi:hypothetical protein